MNKCEKCNKEIPKYHNYSDLTMANMAKRQRFCSVACSNKRGFSEETKEKMRLASKGRVKTISERLKISESKKGAKSHFWKGGVSLINKRIRAGVEFRLWREAVFSRDNWTCQECKVRGGGLHPHHLKRFSDYPELRFSIDNGLTLCADCHKKTDNYGRR